MMADTSDSSPSREKPTIAVVGVGAVGAFYAARLIRAGGVDVHLVLRSDYEAVRERGLQIRSYEGDFSLSPAALNMHRDPADVPKPDLVLVTLKATGNHAFESLIRPMLGPRTAILTLQNGLGNEERLAELFGTERIMGGMAFVCINRLAPGVIHHIDHGFLKIGEHSATAHGNGDSPRVRQVAALFRAAGIRCDVLSNLRRGRWEKLLWNIPFNGLGAVLDLTTDRLLASPAGMDLLRTVMKEVQAVAAADGVTLADSLLEQQITHTQSMGEYQTSMQVDRRQGRALEIDAILGEPLRRARRLQVATPVLGALHGMAALIDPAARTP